MLAKKLLWIRWKTSRHGCGLISNHDLLIHCCSLLTGWPVQETVIQSSVTESRPPAAGPHPGCSVVPGEAAQQGHRAAAGRHHQHCCLFSVWLVAKKQTKCLSVSFWMCKTLNFAQEHRLISHILIVHSIHEFELILLLCWLSVSLKVGWNLRCI